MRKSLTARTPAVNLDLLNDDNHARHHDVYDEGKSHPSQRNKTSYRNRSEVPRIQGRGIRRHLSPAFLPPITRELYVFSSLPESIITC